jgi:glycosyltransferase involved in cell wall biosynthesis
MEGFGLAGRMTYLGHVSDEHARQAWAASDAFVLPSYSEGFSMAILEALACGLPCLITTACHFPELAAAGGAVVVGPTADEVTRGLRDLLERGPEERAELARIGRGLVEREYTWDRQARRLAAIYGWLAGGGPPPDRVEC